MSGDGSIPVDIFREPQTTIGAQDLLQCGVKFHGFLRKCGQLERAVQRVPVLKKVLSKWRQKFVVISKGCLYIYIDEFATSPFQCFSLRGYDQVIREKSQDSVRRKSFSLCSREQQSSRKRYTFGSATENDRKKWMESLKKEMLLANEVGDEDDDQDDNAFVSGDMEGEEPEDEYTYLEKPVKVKEYPSLVPPRSRPTKHPKQTKTTKNKKPLPDPPPGKSDDEDDDTDYDKITELDLTRKRRLPELPSPAQPKEQQKLKTSPAKPKPKPKPKSKPILTKHISRDDFEFKGSDRVQVQSILTSKPEGTYLVRQSRDNDTEVLSVNTSDGLKEFKIFFKNEEYSIDHRTCFPTVESLLDNYTKAPLPNRHDSLSRGYTLSEND